MLLEERIIKTLKDNLEKKPEVTVDSKLVEDLGMDSFDKLMIISALEDEFSITIDEDDFVDIVTVGEIIEKFRSRNIDGEHYDL